MRISDCSSYVCSSDLSARRRGQDLVRHQAAALARAALADAHVGRTQVRTIAAMLDNRPTAPSWSGDADAFVRVEEVVKIFGDTVAVQSVNLSVRRHEVFALLGSSGCGKRSEEHTSELQSLMRISYAVFCLKQKKTSHYSDTRISA